MERIDKMRKLIALAMFAALAACGGSEDTTDVSQTQGAQAEGADPEVQSVPTSGN